MRINLSTLLTSLLAASTLLFSTGVAPLTGPAHTATRDSAIGSVLARFDDGVSSAERLDVPTGNELRNEEKLAQIEPTSGTIQATGAERGRINASEVDQTFSPSPSAPSPAPAIGTITARVRVASKKALTEQQ